MWRPALAKGHCGDQVSLLAARTPAMYRLWLFLIEDDGHVGQRFLQRGQFLFFPAAAQNPVMPHSGKAFGENVQCKSTYKLTGREFQAAFLVVVGRKHFALKSNVLFRIPSHFMYFRSVMAGTMGVWQPCRRNRYPTK